MEQRWPAIAATRSSALLSLSVRRGGIYSVREQADSTFGLLVLSNDRAHRATRECTVCPVYIDAPRAAIHHTSAGSLDLGYLIPRSLSSLDEEVGALDGDELRTLGKQLADLLRIQELCGSTLAPPVPTDGTDHPAWGRTYYADPPLGGQRKRWLVVSHDQYNAATGTAVCVRTTTNTSYAGPEVPLIEGTLRAAVCPDVQNKVGYWYDLPLPQDSRRPTSATVSGSLSASPITWI